MITAIKQKYFLRRELIKLSCYNNTLTLIELSHLTHKSSPLITGTVNDLGNEGYLIESDESKMAPIQYAVNKFCIPRMAEQIAINVSSLTNKSQLLGAAILVVENCHFN